VGEGPEEENLKKIANDLKINDRILFVPSVSREKALDLIAESYLLVLPSLTDFNPNVALEAIGMGTPVLLTKENGLDPKISSKLELFDPENKTELKQSLKKLLERTYYSDYFSRIHELKFDHSWEDVVNQHLKAFEQIL